MKKILYISLASSLFLMSCSSDDEPAISPLVGSWVLDKITISEPPAGYRFASSTTPTATILGESSYELEFFEDMTYERTIRETIFGRVDDDGEWQLTDDELDLIQDNTNVQDLPVTFDLDGDIGERSMTLITKDLWFAWPPSIINDPNTPLDTLANATQEELNAFFNEHGELVTATFELEFDRE